MLNSKQKNILSYSVIIIFTLFVTYLSSQLIFFESKIMPLLICGILLLLTVGALFLELKKPAVTEKKAAQAGSYGIVYCLFWLFLLFFLVYFLGFYIATPVFILAYIYKNGGSLFSCIITAVLATLIIYLIFSLSLQVELYKGMLDFI